MKRATIKDIARLAEVNISTVSRVLNGSAKISEATRQRVEAAAQALDYQPNSAARAMVTQQTRAFAFLVPTLDDPNVAVTALGAEQQAQLYDYAMLVASYHVGEHESPDHFLAEHRVDGLILMSPRHFARPYSRLPMVTLEETPADNAQGGALVAAHLQALGHRRVACLGGLKDSPHSHQRFDSFTQQMRQVHAEVHCQLGDWSAACGYQLAQQLLREKPDITAIFAANDSVALGVLNALHSAGRRVPEDVSVCGFDDQALAQYSWPPLTTVRQPLQRIGASAFELLRSRMSKQATSTQQTLPAKLPVEFILRQSTAPVTN